MSNPTAPSPALAFARPATAPSPVVGGPYPDEEQSPLILVIDDHADTRTIARIVLEDAGFVVADASTGAEGLAAAVELQPQVVLLDMVLPGIDGWAIAARLRRHERTAGCVIIALTALDSLADHDRARLAGCDDVLVKPVKPSTIVRAVAHFAGLPGGTRYHPNGPTLNDKLTSAVMPTASRRNATTSV